MNNKLNIKRNTENIELIITGNQKSGTTVIAKLISAFSQKTVMIDNDAFWYPMSSFIIQNHLEFEKIAAQAIRKPCQIIKEPNFTFFFDKVFNYYGKDKKYLFVIRDPIQNIRSLLERYQIPGNLSQAEFELRFSEKIQIGIFQKEFNKGHYHYIGKLAERWLQAVATYEKYSDNMLLIKYEDFNQNKVKCIRDICNALNFEHKEDIEDKLHIQYQPKGKYQNELSSFFGNNLPLIANICYEKMHLFNYK